MHLGLRSSYGFYFWKLPLTEHHPMSKGSAINIAVGKQQPDRLYVQCKNKSVYRWLNRMSQHEFDLIVREVRR